MSVVYNSVYFKFRHCSRMLPVDAKSADSSPPHESSKTFSRRNNLHFGRPPAMNQCKLYLPATDRTGQMHETHEMFPPACTARFDLHNVVTPLFDLPTKSRSLQVQ